jgi:hypothetical protein
MVNSEIDLLSVDRGVITAPAGCGKTHHIADALTRYIGNKPILVLTHTNAGVTALRSRLNNAGVNPNDYRLYTLDGWSMRIISTFPKRSNHQKDLLMLANPRVDYPNIRAAAVKLIISGHVSDVISSSYSRLIVDEYQDCSVYQHEVVKSVAQILPTCVLGDPLQAIFGFGDDLLADWDKEVCTFFPLIGELSIPWRWINSNSEPLGDWLLDVRRNLLKDEPINLNNAPSSVMWVELDGTNDHQRCLSAARVQPSNRDARILIIGDSRPLNQQQFASQTPGATTVEAVDLKDLMIFARKFKLTESDALDNLVDFAQRVMTNIPSLDIVQRVQSLKRGTARKLPSDVERAAVSFTQSPSYSAAINILDEISNADGVRIYRPAVLRLCVKAIKLCIISESLLFVDAVMQVREQNRFYGRPLPRRGVGSTLLLKGLEADVVVVLNADGLDKRNLYVAMTRGSSALTICSHSQVLIPKR